MALSFHDSGSTQIIKRMLNAIKGMVIQYDQPKSLFKAQAIQKEISRIKEITHSLRAISLKSFLVCIRNPSRLFMQEINRI